MCKISEYTIIVPGNYIIDGTVLYKHIYTGICICIHSEVFEVMPTL